ncbi:hypothetical protein [Intestinibacter sp.]|uniref:hypothetical protein n=1 Tax=Intestinibacter sp. TaxID=1965304 RepID=UPI002A753713|nr:hypothetical protein [Intestinibacter sp.]MDY2737280.1 hypothetical protein [Intestinibacter sp.]
MKYIVFVSVPTKIEVDALNEEDAKKKVYDNLVATKQIKPADYIEINVATEVNA